MDLAPAEPRPDSAATCAFLERAAGGDPRAVGELLARHRPGLTAFVAMHLDPRAAARVDPSDVVQEAQADLPP
jgi:RNA polymerase sigma-70 factor, ECF subfamily